MNPYLMKVRGKASQNNSKKDKSCRMMYKTLPYQILAIVAILLFIAIAPLPYGFYTFLRIIVCGCAVYMACKGFSDKMKGPWPWILSFIAILFNPVLTIHMTKEIWMPVDAITGVIF